MIRIFHVGIISAADNNAQNWRALKWSIIKVCSVLDRFLVHNLLQQMCNIQISNVRLSNVQCPMCNVQYAMCIVQYPSCNVECAGFGVAQSWVFIVERLVAVLSVEWVAEWEINWMMTQIALRPRQTTSPYATHALLYSLHFFSLYTYIFDISCILHIYMSCIHIT